MKQPASSERPRQHHVSTNFRCVCSRRVGAMHRPVKTTRFRSPSVTSEGVFGEQIGAGCIAGIESLAAKPQLHGLAC